MQHERARSRFQTLGLIGLALVFVAAAVHDRRARASSCSPGNRAMLQLVTRTEDGVGVPMPAQDARVWLFSREPGVLELTAVNDAGGRSWQEVYRAPATAP